MIDVMVVEDDVRVARVNAAYVAKVPGFQVVAHAQTVAGALEALEHHHVDLLLLDHYLPDGTGLELVRRMRELGHQADVIMVTAARDLDTVREAMRQGTLQYLVKPFTFAGLHAKLDGYAALRGALSGIDASGQADQAQVDRVFGALRTHEVAPAQPPKGQSAQTADEIRRVLTGADGPLSTQEVAERVGVSRSTAQRYLKYLENAGRLTVTLKYGEAGRPEHRYLWTKRP